MTSGRAGISIGWPVAVLLVRAISLFEGKGRAMYGARAPLMSWSIAPLLEANTNGIAAPSANAAPAIVVVFMLAPIVLVEAAAEAPREAEAARPRHRRPAQVVRAVGAEFPRRSTSGP